MRSIHAAMRLWIQADHEIVQAANDGIFAGGEFVELGIFENEITLAHGAFHFDDAVAHHATETGLRSGRVFNLANRSIEHSAEEKRWIVATGAPFRGFHAGDVLHVFDAFAIPLIVEGRKVVGGTVPLFVNVGVAAFAGLRLHEIFCRNIFAVPRLR